MDLATLGIIVSATGAIIGLDRFTGAANRAAGAGAGVERMSSRLQSAMAALGLAFGTRELIAYADSWKLVEARIGLVTNSTSQQHAAQQQLFAAAQRTRSEYEAVTNLYTRTARNLGSSISASQRQVIDFTETATKGFMITGSSVQEAASSVMQLGQALQSGTLAGDELKTIREAAPSLYRALLEGLRMTGAELKKAGEQGELTSQRVFDAILKYREKIDEQFARMPATVGQSFTGLQNELRRYIGNADGAYGSSMKLAAGIKFVADNLATIISLVTRAVIVWGAYVVALRLVTIAMAAIQWAQTIIALRNTAAGMIMLASSARAVWAALTGPVGIAIALATVVALLISYKSASDRARESTDEFKASLISMSKTEMMVAEAGLDTNIAQIEREMDLLRREGRDKTTVRLDFSTTRVVVSPEMTRLQDQLEMYQLQREALKEQQAAMADLDTVIQSTTKSTDELTKAERARLRILADFRAGLAAMLRDARQELAMSEMQGMAQREQAVRYQAMNELLRMRADLHEKVISGSISARDQAVLMAEAERDVATATQLRLDTMNKVAAFQARNAAANQAREMGQEEAMATRSGIAQEELRIHYQAVNKAIQARNDLSDEALEITLASIRAEEEFGKRMLYVKRIAGDIEQAFAQTFESILNNGLKSFGDLFGGIKAMFIRALAEMQTDRFMKLMADKFGGLLNAALSGGGKASTTAAPVSASAGLASWVAGMGGGHQEYNAGGGPAAIGLEGLTATATTGAAKQREMMKKFAGYLGSALIGASLGQMFGYSSGSASVGALAGGLSGAAAGFAMAGSVGGIIGGVAGLANGILGAHKKQQEMERLRTEVTNRNTATIAALRESINGSPLLSGSNLAIFGSLSKALSGGGFGDFKGGGISAMLTSAINTSAMSKALKGGESSAELKRLEQQYGISFQELGRAAQALGIELFDSNGKLVRSALGQLAEALELTIQAATKFGNNLDDIRRRQEARNALYDLDSPKQKLDDTYEVLSNLAPDLLKQMGLANLNLDTDAGRNVLLQGLREIFELINSGQLTPQLLGSFKDKGELIDAILAAKEGLDAFKNSLKEATTDFPKAMDVLRYELKYGKGTQAERTPSPAVPTPSVDNAAASRGGPVYGMYVSGNLTVVVENYATDTDEDFVRKLESGTAAIAAKGGTTLLRGTMVVA